MKHTSGSSPIQQRRNNILSADQEHSADVDAPIVHSRRAHKKGSTKPLQAAYSNGYAPTHCVCWHTGMDSRTVHTYKCASRGGSKRGPTHRIAQVPPSAAGPSSSSHLPGPESLSSSSRSASVLPLDVGCVFLPLLFRGISGFFLL